MAGVPVYGDGFKLADGTEVISSAGAVKPGGGAAVEAGADVTDATNVAAAGAAMLATQQTWTAGQGSTLRTLTSSAGGLAINVSTGNAFYHDLTEDTQLLLPSSVVAGMVWTLIVEANGTHEMTYWATGYTFGTGTAPDFSAMSDGDWVALTFVCKSAPEIGDPVIGISYTETY